MTSSDSKKATKVSSILTGKAKNVVKKIRTKPRFYRPKTSTRAPQPSKCNEKLIETKKPKFDVYSIIKAPLLTESAIKMIEKNTLVFICHPEANKSQIAHAVETRFKCKVANVNTLIRTDAKKKAFVKLDKSCDAAEIADKLKIL